MLAQIVSPDTGAVVEQLVGTWQPYVAFVAPIFLGLITSESTRDSVKRALPVVVAAILGVISILSEDGLTWQTVVFRVPAMWAVIEVAFRSLSGVVSAVRREDLSVNDVLGRTRGLIR